jgi:hypothetical protein
LGKAEDIPGSGGQIRPKDEKSYQAMLRADIKRVVSVLEREVLPDVVLKGIRSFVAYGIGEIQRAHPTLMKTKEKLESAREDVDRLLSLTNPEGLRTAELSKHQSKHYQHLLKHMIEAKNEI